MTRLFFSTLSTASRTRKLLGAIAASFCFTFEAAGAGEETRMELDYLRVAPVAWLTESSLAPHGDERTTTVPDTLDLAERARAAVHGLTSYLDERHHFSSFGHGLFSTKPPVLIHDQGMAQNWGKLAEAALCARAMCGSRENLDRQRASFEAMLSYGEMKATEPYPVPLARISMAVDALHRQDPRPELVRTLALHAYWLQQQMKFDEDDGQLFFGPEERRWQREDADVPMGPLGYSLQVFTGGNVLRALVRMGGHTPGSVDPARLLSLRNHLLDARFWVPETHPPMAVPAEQGQFWGHHHSYTQALLGLLYWAHETNHAATLEFVRRSYEYLRTYGIARIGLFGESCTTADMTYLAVRLSQWGVGDYWEDVDQYTRNHLTEVQILDTQRLAELVASNARPLVESELGDWAMGLDTRDVVERCRGLFWSDASHPTLIPLREGGPPHGTCLQFVECCSGNCTKALYEVWAAVVDEDPTASIVRVNLLLNRASESLDVESYLPHEGKVVLRLYRDATVAVRVPRWVDRAKVTCEVNDNAVPFAWLGNYVLLESRKRGETLTLTFPIVETMETWSLAWQVDQFWQESTKAPAYWPKREPVRYTLTFRGNTLAKIEPRDTVAGFALYADRSLDRFRAQAPMHRVSRFARALNNSSN